MNLLFVGWNSKIQFEMESGDEKLSICFIVSIRFAILHIFDLIIKFANLKKMEF